MNKLLFSIIIFLLINGGGGIYFVFWRNPLTLLLLILSLTYFIHNINNIKKDIFYSSVITLMFFLLFLFINYIYAIDGQTINSYMYAGLGLFIAFFINTSIKDDFLLKLYKILEFYKYQALLSIFVIMVFKDYFNLIVVDKDRVYYSFLYMFFYLPTDISSVSLGGFSFIRNQGLFWEPGILQLFMNILLFLQFFYFKQSFKKVIATILVIVSTFSTTGLVIMSIIILVKYVTLLKKKKTFLTVPIFIIFSIFFLFILNNNINDKLNGEHKMSAQVRLFDALQSIKIIADHPITGIGITAKAYNDLQQKHYFNIFSMISYNATGNTNSILAIFVMYGIPIGLIWLISLYNQKLIVVQKKLFFLILILGLFSEPILYRLFFVFLVFSGFSNFLKSKIKSKYILK